MKRILVVEDSTNERLGLRRLLERSGFCVRDAANGFDALQQLESEQFDLLVVDVWLPGMNGLELVSHLPIGSRPRLLFVTGDDTAGTLLKALREHAHEIIYKPFDPKQLMETIKSALEAPDSEEDIQVLSADPHWVELRFSCDPQTVTRIQELVRKLDSDLPTKVRQSTELAFHELLMNAVEWGGHMNPRSKVQIACLRTEHLLMYRIADPGPGFKLEDLSHAAIGHADGFPFTHTDVREKNGMRPGGFGILMARGLVDELVYNEAHNEVVFLKYLKGSEN
jgi:DNA-binding response OmpR family regulator